MSQQQTHDSIGFGGLLFIVFLILKLTHTVNWSWWLVTAPLWGPLAFLAALVVALLLIHVWTR